MQSCFNNCVPDANMGGKKIGDAPSNRNIRSEIVPYRSRASISSKANSQKLGSYAAKGDTAQRMFPGVEG